MFWSIPEYFIRRKAPMYSQSPRYFASGPDHWFYADDLEFTRKLCNLIDPEGDDWTITDEWRK